VEREARDRELQEADKRLEEAKAKAAAKARAAAAKGHDEAAAATAAQEKDDDLAGFFSEIGAGGAGAGGAEDKAKQQKLVSEAYAKADLGQWVTGLHRIHTSAWFPLPCAGPRHRARGTGPGDDASWHACFQARRRSRWRGCCSPIINGRT
jgi:hypothetical protein